MLRNKLRVMGFQAGVGMDTEFGRVKRPKKKRECESSSDESNDCRVDVAQKKLSSSQAQLGQATYLAVALFISASCATSTPSTLYSLCSMTINGDMELTTRVK